MADYDRELIASMLDAAVRGNSGYTPDAMTRQAELLRAADSVFASGSADAMHWIDRYAAGWDAECQLDRVADALLSRTPDSAAPDGGGVEQMARELLQRLMDAPYGDTTAGNMICAEALFDRLEAAWLPVITAALRQPAQVVVEEPIFHLRGYGDVTKEELERLAVPQAAPVPVEGEGRRFRGVGHLEETGYIPSGSAAERDGTTCIQDDATDQQLREWSERHGLEGVLSCCDLRAAFEDAQSLCLITPPSQPVHVEGEELESLRQQIAALTEERDLWFSRGAAILNVLPEHIRLGDLREAVEDVRKRLTTPLPSQPAVELEQFRPAVELYVQILRQKLSEKRAFRLDVAAAQRDFEGAERLLALIDGAKAGREESP